MEVLTTAMNMSILDQADQLRKQRLEEPMIDRTLFEVWLRAKAADTQCGNTRKCPIDLWFREVHGLNADTGTTDVKVGPHRLQLELPMWARIFARDIDALRPVNAEGWGYVTAELALSVLEAK